MLVFCLAHLARTEQICPYSNWTDILVYLCRHLVLIKQPHTDTEIMDDWNYGGSCLLT